MLHTFLFLLLLPATLVADESARIYDDSQVAEVHVSVDPLAMEWMYSNPFSDSLHLASYTFQNATIDTQLTQVGFRLRGNTSRTSAKKSFKLDLNHFVDGREWLDVDKLNLNGEHNDPAVSRSKLVWDLYQRVTWLAPRASHAALHVNDLYMGLYVNVEHIDKDFLNKRPLDSSGNLWKCLWPADLRWRGPDPENYKHVSGDRRVYELKSNEEADDYSQLVRLIRIAATTPADRMRDSLEAVIHIEDVARYFALNVLTGSWDSYRFLRNNFYLYHDPSEDRFRLIPYDMDNVLGIDWFSIDWTSTDPLDWPRADGDDRPLADAFLSVPAFRDLFVLHLEHYADRLFDALDWQQRCQQLYDQLWPHARPDSFRTMDYGFDSTDFADAFGPGPHQQDHVTHAMREFLAQRLAGLAEQLEYSDGGPVLWNSAWEVTGGELSFSVSAWSHTGIDSLELALSREGEELARLRLEDPGPALDNLDSTWLYTGLLDLEGIGGECLLRLSVYRPDGETMEWPGRGLALALPLHHAQNLRVTELMPRNDATIADGQGDYDDWLELANLGPETIALAGFGMSDNPDTPFEYVFPDTSLAPGERLLLWCDNDETDPGLHAPFALSGSGDDIVLSDPSGGRLQLIEFGSVAVDQSLHLPCDAQVDTEGQLLAFVVSEEPTPGEPNACPPPAGLWVRRQGNDLLLEWDPGPATQWQVFYMEHPWDSEGEVLGNTLEPFFLVEGALQAGSQSGWYRVALLY